MRRDRILFGFYGLLAAAVLFTPFINGCTSKAPDFFKDAKPGQQKVLVSFAPLFTFTHAVGGDECYILCLTTSAGPHEFQGTPADIFKVNKADLYIYNGLTLDEVFTDKMLQNHRNTKLQLLDLGKALLKARNLNAGPGERGFIIVGNEKVKHGDHWHGAEDPHYWLGPSRAKAAAGIIAAKLGELDPPNASKYQTRADEFGKKLDALKAYGDKAFAGKKNRKFITMHDSLRYFAKEFDLDHAGSIQNQPGTDPHAKAIVDLIELCKTKDVRVIAIEPQYSAAQAENIRDAVKRHGIDIKIVTFDPIETAPISGKHGPGNPDPDYYLTKMRENIDNLAKALP